MFKMTPPPFRSSVMACACAGMLLATAVHAQENNPYYAGATVNTTSNSNIYLSRPEHAQSDTITSAGLRVGLDQSIGRQQLVADLGINANRYSSATKNNNTSYNLSSYLNWETIERLSGTLTLGASQARSEDNSTATATNPSPDLNLLRSHQANFQARLGSVTQLTFEAGLAMSQNKYSALAYQSGNMHQQAFNAGVRFRPSSESSLWLGERHTSARYPNYSVVSEDRVGRNDIDLIGNMTFSADSAVNARISLTRESHSAIATRDSRGWTGALGWTVQPTGKLKFGLNLSRDSSVGATDYAFNLVSATTNFDKNDTNISSKFGLTGEWSATALLSVTAGWSYTHRTLDSSFTTSLLNGASGTDNTSAVNLGLRYVPLRNVELGCNVAWTDRKASDEVVLAALTYPYKVTTTSCYGQVYLR